MLRNSNGFTLTECLVSLLILTIGIQFLLPVLVKAQVESQTIHQHETALMLLHNALVLWEENETLPPTNLDLNGVHYYYDWQSPKTAVMKLCIKWSVSSYQRSECGELTR